MEKWNTGRMGKTEYKESGDNGLRPFDKLRATARQGSQ